MTARPAGLGGRLAGGPFARLGAILQLARWPNALIAAAGVVVGAWWARAGDVITPAVGWAALAAVLATTAINALNDIFDVEIDRTSHPTRPLVLGALTRREALVVAAAALPLALVAAGVAGGRVPAFVGAALLVGLAYSPLLKPMGLVGNLAVAAAASLPFLVGAEAVGDAAGAFALFAIAIPLHVAREVMKDIADAAGDVTRRRTLAVTRGPRVARGVAIGAVAAHAILVTFLLAPAGARLLALLPSVALAGVATVRIAAARAALLLKIAMLLAMAALPLLR